MIAELAFALGLWEPFRPVETWTVPERPAHEFVVTEESIARSHAAIEAWQKEQELESWAAYHKRIGVIEWNGWAWTWYSQRVLDGSGLSIEGRHVGTGGYVMDGEGYICLASSVLSYGTVIDTPMGVQGRVYDSGCAEYVVDIYVDW